jgi:beta-glucanase (GH16 family)
MNGNWSSARLISKNKAEFKYGRIVFRAKLPTGSGTWPALWLLGEDISTIGWPACGEIDVMEHVGKTMGIIHHAIHTPSSYGNTVNKKQTNIANVATEFHEYQLNWTPQKLEFSIDGFVTYVYSPVVKTNANWPFNKEMFLIVNIAMGGNFGSDPQYETGGLKNGIDPSLSSATMLVDWIRVYQIVSPTNEPIASENWPEGLKILPNPSFGPLSVKLPIQDSTAYFLLSDLSGKVVLEKTLPHQENALDVSTLPKGNYIAQIFTQNQVYVGKVILQ